MISMMVRVKMWEEWGDRAPGFASVDIETNYQKREIIRVRTAHLLTTLYKLGFKI